MPLLGELQRMFEATYGRRAGVELEACVVGRERFAELAARCDGGPGAAGPDEPPDERCGWARFFYTVRERDLRVAIFYDDDVIATLEARDPRRALTESNLLPFLVFTEECSHAVHTSLAFGEGGSARVHAAGFLHELELLGRIDAYLLLRHFVQRHARRFTAGDRAWVRHHAVTRWDVPFESPALEDRYRSAARLAGRFVDHLEALPAQRRVPELRRLRRLRWPAKTLRIARLDEAAA
jgi:hypothetical protein